MAVDELIDVAGRGTIEAVLTLSAREPAGPKRPDRTAGAISGAGPLLGGFFQVVDSAAHLADLDLVSRL